MKANGEPRLVLEDFADGVLIRGRAMEVLGFDWSGDLLTAMNEAGIKHLLSIPEALSEMNHSLSGVFPDRPQY